MSQLSTDEVASTQSDPVLHYSPPDSATYPIALQHYRYSKTLPSVGSLGDLRLLQYKFLACFCSPQCPERLIQPTYEVAQTLCDAAIPIISGFHSPIEQKILALLLGGSQPVIHCPARSLENMRLSPELKAAIGQNRLLLLSPFPVSQKRATADLAEQRNRFVTALATAVFVVYAAPGGKTEALVHQALAWGKPVLTLASSENEDLLKLGAKPVQLAAVAELLA